MRWCASNVERLPPSPCTQGEGGGEGRSRLRLVSNLKNGYCSLGGRTLSPTLSLGTGRGRQARRAFTLIEVLAALLLIGIVLPAIMKGIAASSSAASSARHRNEASGLVESKLGEIVATNQWQDNTDFSGDFGTDWPDYKWHATVQPWAGDTTGTSLQQLDVTVTWLARGREDSMTLSTLVYQRSTTTTTATTP